MNDNKVYLGFDDKEEGLLYEDVCAGILNPEAISESTDLPVIIKKDDCVKLIKEEELENIFDYVKGLSRVERLKQLYTYHFNYINLIFLKVVYIMTHSNNSNDFSIQMEIFAWLAKMREEVDATNNIIYTVNNELNIRDQENFAEYLEDLHSQLPTDEEKQL